jgi:hypothetical protein
MDRYDLVYIKPLGKNKIHEGIITKILISMGMNTKSK